MTNLLRVQVALWSLQWQNHLQANQQSAPAIGQCQGFQQRESHPKIKGKAERKVYQSIPVEYVKKSVKTIWWGVMDVTHGFNQGV